MALSFVGALAAGHHPTLAALALPLGLAILLRRPAALRDRRALPRLAAMCAAAALIGLLPLLYLPIRAAQHAPLAPADLATWGGVWRHVTAAGFRAATCWRSRGRATWAIGCSCWGTSCGCSPRRWRWRRWPSAPPGWSPAGGPKRSRCSARRSSSAGSRSRTVRRRRWSICCPPTSPSQSSLAPGQAPCRMLCSSGYATSPPPDLGEGVESGGLLGRAATVGLAILAAAAFDAFGLPMHGRAPALAVAAVPDLSAVTRLAADPMCLPGYATVLASWHYVTPLWLAGRRDANAADGATDSPYVTASGAPIVYVHLTSRRAIRSGRRGESAQRPGQGRARSY
ncbi:MAG: hypothetical protein U0470_11920 [Anaerolineae bacterium]